MKRRAIIIYCDNTQSGKLAGPLQDARNLKYFLMSLAGGEWRRNEIAFLRNPTGLKVKHFVNSFTKGADYTFTVFSGHGFINQDDGFKQYIELQNKDLSIHSLINKAPKQTIIIDACRGYYSPQKERLMEETSSFLGDVEHFEEATTREIFNTAIRKADKGLTVLYSSNENETSLDTPSGGAFLFSLLYYCQHWSYVNSHYTSLPLHTAFIRGSRLMKEAFDTIQKPIMNREKRIRHFPLAVKVGTRPKLVLQYLN